MPIPRWTKPVGAIVLTAAMIAALRGLPIRIPPTPRFVVRTTDGLVHICGVSAANKVIVHHSFAVDGTGLDNWQFSRLWLSPDQAWILVLETEQAIDAIDSRLTLYAGGTGDPLFSRTDNSFPTGQWTTDQKPVPTQLADLQAFLDTQWEADGKQGPRPVASYRFTDHPWESTVDLAGWRKNGFVIDGSCAIEMFTDGAGMGPSDPEPWWAVVQRQGTDWNITSTGPGPAPPPGVTLLAVPPLSRPVALAGSNLTIGGVVQVHPKLVSGVTHLAGPYLG